ncbi:hypothetical protein Lesp02_69980 [Lentzea sp. NBRC 105346]|nr:hypothetical protein Lesp02_69980 [Lentzea sp. NBRC 105346]
MSLGVSPSAEALYRRLVTSGPQPAGPSSAELLAAGLATRSPCHPGMVVAVLPEVVCDGLLARFAADLAERQAVVRNALLEAMHEDDLPAGEFEVLTDPQAIKRTASEVLIRARADACEFALATHDPSLTSVPLPLTPNTAPGVRYRVVYASSCLRSPLGRQIIEASRELGEEQRFFPGSLAALRIGDDVALVRLSSGALLVRAPALVQVLRTWFELVWERGGPLDSANPLSPKEMAVLELQAAGHKDAAIARALGINVRTVRRHVATILATLGVESRFAAGVEAARRGWL